MRGRHEAALKIGSLIITGLLLGIIIGFVWTNYIVRTPPAYLTNNNQD